MPGLTVPTVAHYVHAPPTNAALDFADLPIIDLAKTATSEGLAELAVQVRDAMTEQGFFYVINHGYTQAQTDRVFDIADVAFSLVEPEEKQTYIGRMKETGSYRGYKLRQYWQIESGVNDQIEMYSMNRQVGIAQHPEALRPFLPEIDAFTRHNHFNVLHPILRLLALGLELPAETFVARHGYDAVGETYARFMKYFPHSEDDEMKTKNVWLKGHTDFGTVTIVWSQPVAALQILSPDGKWRWIRHIDNALVINAGDAMEFLSGGFYKATIHRVVQPPLDQRGHTRLAVFYFAMCDDDVRLIPYAEESPVLKKVGARRRCDDADAPTMEAWRKGRTSAYGQSQLKISQDERVEEEVINGVVVKHYN